MMLRALLFPRPKMILANGLQFGAGLLFALLEGAASGGQSWINFTIFVLIWFLVQEFLVQQAKYMWNDLRDQERDQGRPENGKRPLAQIQYTRLLYLLLGGRWLLGFVLAWLISPNLLAIVLLTSLLQVFYEFMAKPRAGEAPLTPLFTVAASALLKFSGGALAAGWWVGDARFWLYGLAMFATGVVYVSSFWRVEAAFFLQKGLGPARRQSAYFKHYGLDWLFAGGLVSIGACWLLFLDAYGRFLSTTSLSTVPVLLIISALGIVTCLCAFALVRRRSTLRQILVPVFFVGFFLFILGEPSGFNLLPSTPAAPLIFLILLLIDYRANYGMDYKQQNLIYLQENWPGWRRVVRSWRRPLWAAGMIWNLNTPHGGDWE